METRSVHEMHVVTEKASTTIASLRQTHQWSFPESKTGIGGAPVLWTPRQALQVHPSSQKHCWLA